MYVVLVTIKHIMVNAIIAIFLIAIITNYISNEFFISYLVVVFSLLS